jgi:hypothetical protein
MSSSRVWERIIENEEDVKKIEESFKRMDEYTKNFQVSWPSKNLWASMLMQSSLARNFVED